MRTLQRCIDLLPLSLCEVVIRLAIEQIKRLCPHLVCLPAHGQTKEHVAKIRKRIQTNKKKAKKLQKHDYNDRRKKRSLTDFLGEKVRDWAFSSY